MQLYKRLCKKETDSLMREMYFIVIFAQSLSEMLLHQAVKQQLRFVQCLLYGNF